MSLPLRQLNCNVFKVVQRYCRPYSTQVDGLRLDGSVLDSCTREDEYHITVTERVASILEEGKKIAISVCGSSSENHEDISKLHKKANQLRVHFQASPVVPHFNFHDVSVPPKNDDGAWGQTESDLNCDDLLAIKTALQRHRQSDRPIQSYSYGADVYGSPSNDGISMNGETLDELFMIDNIPLPQHVLAYLRENSQAEARGNSKAPDCNKDASSPLGLFESELQSLTESQVSCSELPNIQVKSSGSDDLTSKKDEDLQDQQKPSRDQLVVIHDIMTQQLPRILISRHNYTVYTPDVVFENNFYHKPYITKGIAQYVVEVAKLRIWAHFKYANVKMSLLKSTIEEQEGTVTFHWRMSGLPQIRAFMFWKFLPWTYSKNMKQESDFHDGISTFHVNNSGLIHKHQLDRMIMDKEFEPAARTNLKEKLNKLIQPKPAIGAAYKYKSHSDNEKD